MSTERLVRDAQSGDVAAFTELVRRFQNMAFGYALSVLGDARLAEDATQEAFIAAYVGLSRLQEPAAFPGWLRGIVRHQCHRLLRDRYLRSLPLEDVTDLSAPSGEPHPAAEQGELRASVRAAIDALPPSQREVVLLFYLAELSQREVAAFLGLPVTTVNNRLHTARTALKRSMLTMMEEDMKRNALPDDFAARIGRIIAVSGPVVDARFDEAALPHLLDALTVTDAASAITVTVQVAQQHRAAGTVRGVTVSPTARVQPGMKAANTGTAAHTPLDRTTAAEVVRTISAMPERRTPEILETGIKVVDLFCPFLRGGNAGIFSVIGVGKLVIIEEIVHRLAGREHGLSLFTFVQTADVPAWQAAIAKEPTATLGTAGPVQTFHLLSDDANDPERAVDTSMLDALVLVSPDLAKQGLYPAIDPLKSRSRALDSAIVGPEHMAIVERARDLLQQAEQTEPQPDRLTIDRARKLRRFLTQPFYVGESYTNVAGVDVSRTAALEGCRAIIEGRLDDLPEKAFFMAGTINDVQRRAAEPAEQ